MQVLLWLVDTNECDSSPCLNNGKCINTEGGYLCECTAGWTGNRCERSKYEVSSEFITIQINTKIWKYFGILSLESLSSLLELYEFFVMADKNECLNYPCLHGGSCRDTIGSFRCTCKQGWTGEICKDGKRNKLYFRCLYFQFKDFFHACTGKKKFLKYM